MPSCVSLFVIVSVVYLTGTIYTMAQLPPRGPASQDNPPTQNWQESKNYAYNSEIVTKQTSFHSLPIKSKTPFYFPAREVEKGRAMNHRIPTTKKKNRSILPFPCLPKGGNLTKRGISLKKALPIPNNLPQNRQMVSFLSSLPSNLLRVFHREPRVDLICWSLPP